MVYILRTSGNTLYIGLTNNLDRRLVMHKRGKGSKYLRSFDSFALVYTETVGTKSDALKREYALKQLTHDEKEKLIVSSLYNSKEGGVV
jgi:putative endonuclease